MAESGALPFAAICLSFSLTIESVSRQTSMGGRCDTVLYSNPSRCSLSSAHTSYSPTHRQESSHDNNVVCSPRQDHVKILQVFDRQCIGFLLRWYCCLAISSIVNHSNDNPRGPANCRRQFPHCRSFLCGLASVFDTSCSGGSEPFLVIFTTAMHGGFEIALCMCTLDHLFISDLIISRGMFMHSTQ